MLEAYCACGDFETMANMVEELICHLAEKFCGGLQIDHKDAEGNVLYTIDLSRPWKRADYQDLIRGVAGQDWFDISPEERRARCEELDVEISPDMKDVDVSQQVYEKLVEEKTMNPCFVTHVAKDLVPLAKLNRENPDVVDVYELVINGQEISPGYSELNDPDVQKERLEHQAAGETQRVDYDFIETLEYGMPSAGGIGIGIDRVIMMLTGASSIRDVLLFPQLRQLIYPLAAWLPAPRIPWTALPPNGSANAVSRKTWLKAFPPPAGCWGLCATAWGAISAGTAPPAWWRRNSPELLQKARWRIFRNG